MNDLISVWGDKCVGCNKCIRACPSPEANRVETLENGKRIITVDPKHCIACGECVRVCKHGARDYADDTSDAMALISKTKCVVLVTPSIKTVFPKTWKGILNWFKRNGCKMVDVSFGADICTWGHVKAIKDGIITHTITQPCAAIVKYIETYQPSLISNLSPIHSPIACAAVYVKKYLKWTDPIIAITPCVAKKQEFVETGLVDYNVTFRKLSEYIEKNGLMISENEGNGFTYDFEHMQGQVGAIYPRPGGLRDNIWLHDPDIDIATSEGVHNVYPDLDEYATLSDNEKPTVFDVLSCQEGCNVGAGSGTSQTRFGIMAVMRDVEKEAKSRRKVKGGFFRGAEDVLFKQFDETLKLGDFFRDYKPLYPSPRPNAEQLEEIFNSMGKCTKEDREYDCTACGYKSCLDMATAIYRGLNVVDNCDRYAKIALEEKHAFEADKNKLLSDIAERCRSISAGLVSDVDSVKQTMDNIDSLNEFTSTRTQVVRDLLENVISYCTSNTALDRNGLETMADILRKTLSAFDDLSDTVTKTTENTTSATDRVADIRKLVSEIDAVLNDTASKSGAGAKTV